MTITDWFDWFALESKYVAQQTDDPKQREVWIRLAELWASAARGSRDQAEHRGISPR
jgi:hypothetical protein